MKLNILLRYAEMVRIIFWLQHTGNLYYGFARDKHHWSHHKSGKVHFRKNEGGQIIQHFPDDKPLDDIQFRPLKTFSFFNSHKYVKSLSVVPRYKFNKADALFYIDSRSLPRDVAVEVTIGLVSPTAMHMLAIDLMHERAFSGNAQKQIFMATNVAPFVYAKFNISGTNI